MALWLIAFALASSAARGERTDAPACTLLKPGVGIGSGGMSAPAAKSASECCSLCSGACRSARPQASTTQTRAGRACGHLVTRAAKRQFLLARRARSSESSRERLGDDTIHDTARPAACSDLQTSTERAGMYC